jgi:translation initiation factor IF-3
MQNHGLWTIPVRTDQKETGSKKETKHVSGQGNKGAPKTGEHDLQTKIGHIKKFIGRKDKVKVTVVFRGREITLSKLGMSLLEQIAIATEETATVEQHPKFEGRSLIMILAPR